MTDTTESIWKRLSSGDSRASKAFMLFTIVSTALTIPDLYFWWTAGRPFLPIATGTLALIEVFEWGMVVGFFLGLGLMAVLVLVALRVKSPPPDKEGPVRP